LDTTDPTAASYSNARLFVLTHSNLTDFADLCLSEHQATLASVQSHRIGFYRYSAQQSPPVNAFFLQDRSTSGETGYEVVDFLHNYDLILTAEESAAQGQSSQSIHSSAYEDHRRYYYQEPRVARLIGYLYIQAPNVPFTDDELSTVNWAVF